MRAPSRNAFTQEFLAILNRLDEPATAPEAELVGPWKVVPTVGGFAVLRREESLEEGDEPTAVLATRQLALLAAAVLPGVGRGRQFELDKTAGEEGFAVLHAGEVAGQLPYFDDRITRALHTVESLVRSPASLALLLEAAGGSALSRTGRILRRRFQPLAGS